MVSISHVMFPHLFDIIFDHLEYEGLLSLRATSRDLKARVDRTLAAHIFVSKKTICHPSGSGIPSLMDWHDSCIREVYCSGWTRHQAVTKILATVEVLDIDNGLCLIDRHELAQACPRLSLRRVVGKGSQWDMDKTVPTVFLPTVEKRRTGKATTGTFIHTPHCDAEGPAIIHLPFDAADPRLPFTQTGACNRTSVITKPPSQITIICGVLNGPIRDESYYTYRKIPKWARSERKLGMMAGWTDFVLRYTLGPKPRGKPAGTVSFVGILDLPGRALGLPSSSVVTGDMVLEVLAHNACLDRHPSAQEVHRHLEVLRERVRFLSLDEYQAAVGPELYALHTNRKAWVRGKCEGEV